MILLDLIGRDEEPFARGVESARAAIGGQASWWRLHPQQFTQRIQVLAAVEAPHGGAAAGVCQRLASHDDRPTKVVE